MPIDWTEHHRFQEKEGYCGVAVVQMILENAGINKSQKNIARYLYKSWFGTPRVLILSYLSKYFNVVNYKTNAKISDIAFHLKRNNIVLVNWFDDNMGQDDGDGHYSLVASCEKGTITLVDPSNQRSGIWSMKTKDFSSRWFDYTDLNNRTYSEGYILWLDPKSRR
jgi:ABC-type bacteriocin/lantibiotic exporter with double-glycine peptidase domain